MGCLQDHGWRPVQFEISEFEESGPIPVKMSNQHWKYSKGTQNQKEDWRIRCMAVS